MIDCFEEKNSEHMNNTNSVIFSIIIPTYNRAEKLQRALDSVASQTFPDYEVIVCDDGSRDHTQQVINIYSRKMDLKFILGKHWGGPARPRNNGLKIARGEFVAFLDADDWWYPNKLEEANKYLYDADFVYHDLDVYTQRGKRGTQKVKGRHLRSPKFVDLMKNENAIINSSAVIRRSVLNLAGELDEDRNLISVEDFDLWLRVAKITEKFSYIPKSLGAYWMDCDNISMASEKLVRRVKSIYNKHLASLSDADKAQAEMIMSYLIGRTKQKLGLTREAVGFFKKSIKSKNLKYKLRSLFLLITSGFKLFFRISA